MAHHPEQQRRRAKDAKKEFFDFFELGELCVPSSKLRTSLAGYTFLLK
jgi:hypothetical protein